MGLRQWLFGWDVFVSYSWADQAVAVCVQALLEAGGLRVFRDETGTHPGEQLQSILAQVERSTALVVVVSAASLARPWVKAELNTYRRRPEKRQTITPIFIKPHSATTLPEDLAFLANHLGIHWPADPSSEQLEDLQNRLLATFRATRKRTRQVRLAVGVAVGLGALAWGWTTHLRRLRTQDGLLAEAERRADELLLGEAEACLAEANALGSDARIADRYRQLRARRLLEAPTGIPVGRWDQLLAVGEGSAGPYLVLDASEQHLRDEPNPTDDLTVMSGGLRHVLLERCESVVQIVTHGDQVLFTCGARLGRWVVGQAGPPQMIELAGYPEDLKVVVDGRGHESLYYLLRDETSTRLGAVRLTDLQVVEEKPVDRAVGGEVGFCPVAGGLLWSAHSDSGSIVIRTWPDTASAWSPGGGQEQIVRLESGGDMPALVSGVVADDECRRFYLGYAPIRLHEALEASQVRVRLDALRPADRLDEQARRLLPAPAASGLDALYQTQDKDLRAVLLTSEVIVQPTIRGVTSQVERLARWPRDPAALWSLVVKRGELLVYRNLELQVRLLLGAAEPLALRTSPLGAWVAVQNEAGVILWRAARPWNGAVIPEVDEVLAATRLPADQRTAACVVRQASTTAEVTP